MSDSNLTLETLTGLCKRRGFIVQSSEIYGGLNGFWDYGPLGTELKNNLRDLWWRDLVHAPPMGPDGRPVSIVGLDSAIIQNPKTWEASGHLAGFTDPMVDCRQSKRRYRADHLMVYAPTAGGGVAFAFVEGDAKPALKHMKKAGAKEADHEVRPFMELDETAQARAHGPDAGEAGTLTPPREFNLMFKTYVGATSGEDNVAYLRPETAQGIFLNYKTVVDTMRVKVPFGIAQIGKSFRNEVTPRNFIFRSREFEQMEMEWFCHPSEAKQWLEFWKTERMRWWRSLGVSGDNLVFRDHEADELSHYAKEGYGTVDVEYRYPFTAPDYGELEGIAHRCDYDLTQHQRHAKAKLEYFDEQTKERYIPHVIEPASGLTRAVLVVLCEAYREEWVPRREGDPILPAEPGAKPPEDYELRTVLKFAPQVAPVKVAVFPLLKNRPELMDKAGGIYRELRTRFHTQFDAAGAIGRRYRRQDEIGTPFCVTVDFDSLGDDTVTVRDRDSMRQERVPVAELAQRLGEKLG